MSVLIQALTTLKSELEQIAQQPLGRKTDGLDDKNAAKQLFANPSILPGIPDLRDTKYTHPNSSSYSDNVVQAIWNIADIASWATNKIMALAIIKDKRELELNFDYLDEESWVPKIIDDTTYQAGKALIKFLNTLTTDENALDVLPTQDIKNKVTAKLQSMRVVLETRIDLYELHLPKAFHETVDALKVKKERRTIWHERRDPLSDQMREAETIYMENWPTLNQHRGTDSTALVAANQRVMQAREILLQQFAEFNRFKDDWHRENESLGLPTEVRASDLALALGYDKPASDIKHWWIRLYNGGIRVHDERIASALNSDYESAIQIEKAVEQLIGKLDGQSKMLESSIAECALLKTYEDDIELGLRPIVQPVQPDFLRTESDGQLSFVFVSSTKENELERNQENVQLYQLLIENLAQYRQSLISYERTVTAANENLALNHPPLEADAKTRLCQLSTEVLVKKQELLTTTSQKNQLQIEAVSGLIAKAQAEQNAVTYAQEIQSFINSLDPAEKSPEFINTDGSEPLLVFKASQNDNKQAALTEDSQAYDNLLLGLQSYKRSLANYQSYLQQQQVQMQNAFAIPSDTPQAYVDSYQQAFDKAKATIQQKMDLTLASYEAIAKLQLATIQQKSEIDFELAKMSDEGRRKVLENAGIRIRDAFDSLQRSQRQEVAASAKHNAFLINQYDPAIREIHSQFDKPLEKLQSQIGQTKQYLENDSQGLRKLELSATARTEYLQAASARLTVFKKILEESTGLYVPAQQVPKAELLSLLECLPDSKEARLLDEMYATEQSGSSWYGLNFANLKNKFNHHTTLFGASDFDWDMHDLVRVLKDRLKQIDDELKIEIDSQTEPQKAPAGFAENSLYTLWRFYQKTQRRIENNEERLEQLQQEHSTLSINATRSLAVWQGKKEEQDRELTIVQLHRQLTQFNHALAMLAADSYRLEYQLDNIAEEAGRFSRLVVELTTQDNLQQVQALYESNLSTYSDIDTRLDAKASFRDYSPHELAPRVKDALSSLARTRAELEHLANSISDCPEILRESLALLSGELDGLETRRKATAKTVAHLEQDLPELKAAFDDLGQLAQIDNELSLLLEQSQDPDLDEPTKLQLTEEIETALAKHQDYLDELRTVRFNSIEERIVHVDSLINNQDGLMHFIARNKLAQIETRYAELALKTTELAAKFMHDFEQSYYDEALDVANEIVEELDKHDAFLRQCKEIPFQDVQESFRTVDSFEDVLREFIIDPFMYINEPEIPEPEPLEPFEDQIDALITDFFGSPIQQRETSIAGFFGAYLHERAETYAWRDWFSTLAATVLGVFGYQTESAKRQEFVENLNNAISIYERAGCEANYQIVTALITTGKETFSPRAKEGDEHDKSLFAKLSLLERRIERVERDRIVDDERVRSELAVAV
ncbi:hypothetical protein [Legionella massiliensis]|nr:hypothetical protein [Legionella massiliensis]